MTESVSTSGNRTIVVTSGFQGPQGINGTNGFGVYVQDTLPVSNEDKYIWVQTGLGTGGTDYTFWIEDGT